MATDRPPPRRVRRPPVGSLVTGTLVGQVKKGALVELGELELVLPRSRFGAAADLIDAASYGDPLTVEVVAEPSHKPPIGLTRLGIERSVRQPRGIDGRIERVGQRFVLHPDDRSPAFDVVVLDHPSPEVLHGASGRWQVGAPHRGCRLVIAWAPDHRPLA